MVTVARGGRKEGIGYLVEPFGLRDFHPLVSCQISTEGSGSEGEWNTDAPYRMGCGLEEAQRVHMKGTIRSRDIAVIGRRSKTRALAIPAPRANRSGIPASVATQLCL